MSVTLHRSPSPTLSTLLIAPRRGDDVLQVLREALAAHAVGNAWIVGRGTFEEIELRDGDQTRTFATTSRIVALDGRARAGSGEGEVVLAATVSRNGTRGPEFLVGEVVRAVAGAMELLVTPLPLAGSPGASDGDPQAHDDEPRHRRDARDEGRIERSPAAPAPWAALAEASAEAHARPSPPVRPSAQASGNTARAVVPASPSPRSPTYDPRKPGSGPSPLPPPSAPIPPKRKSVDEEIYPEPGDLLDHFAFGRCVVLTSDGDEMVVQNPTSGRTRTIRVSALHAEQSLDEDGKRLFRLTQRRSS